MNFILKFLSFVIIVNSVDSAYYCDVFGSPSQGGIGCELEEEVIRAEEREIVLSHYNPPKTAKDIVWLEINFSNFSASPKPIFETFENLKRVEINNSTGLRVMEVPCFLQGLEEIFIVRNDVQIIGKHAYEGLSSLKRLDMSHNAINDIDADAFKDLSRLKFLNLSHNQIESLKPATFSSNINLVVIRLAHNKIKFVDVHLFLGNTQLQFLDLHRNEISQIGKGFTNGLLKLGKIDLKANECVDETINHVAELDNFLKKCFEKLNK